MLASRDLYQLIHQRRTMKGHKPITRIFVAILLKEANIQDGDKHLVQWLDQKRNEAFKKADEAKVNRMEVQDLSFTGFTVVYGPLVLSFLENLPEGVDDLIRHLKEASDKEESSYEKVKILAVNEENPERLLPEWANYKLNDTSPIVVTEVEKPNEEMCKRVCEIYKSFLDASWAVKDLLNEGFTTATKNEFMKKIILEREDPSILIYSFYPSVQEYVSLFFDEEELVLEDELAFPQPAYLSEYLEYRDQPFSKYNGFKG